MSRLERPSRTDSASGKETARRGLGFDSVTEADSIRFGCSMLSRIRLRPENPDEIATMRCSLGYALRSEEDIERCMAVEGPADCWKTAQSWRVTPQEQPVAAPRKRRAARSDSAAGDARNGTIAASVIKEQSVEVVRAVNTAAHSETGADG